jgi:O-antigen/teichoic acid export membrane protein
MAVPFKNKSPLHQRIFTNPLVRRIIRNSSYLFSATGISAGLSMIQSILTARLLGVAGFGILGAITMFTSVVNKFASFRMSELVVKYVGQFSEENDPQRASAVFKIAALLEMLASITAFGLLWLLAPLGARYLAKDITTQSLFILYGLILIANLVSESSTGILQIFDRFRYIAYSNVLQSVVTLAIIAVIYLLKGGLQGILVAYLVGKAVSALAISVIAMLEATHHWGGDWWKVKLRILLPQAKELGMFALSTNISASLSLINKDSELLWISFFRNPVETGYYKLALALANLVQLPVSPLPQATYPELSREVAHRNWKNVRYILRQGSYIAGGYTLAATLGLLLLGRTLIRYLYTPEYLPAFPALLILLAGFIIANTFYWNRTALLAIGRPDFPVKINLILAVLKVVGIITLVPVYGYLVNAGLMSGSYIIGVSISVIVFYQFLKKQEKFVNE